MGIRNNGLQEQPLADTEAIDNLETDRCSDADSESGEPITPQDFRVYQFTTRSANSKKARQYWTWDPEHGKFTCHVLKISGLVDRDEHVELHGFSVRLRDVAGIHWNLETQQVYLKMRDRVADIMVKFKRQNTMRRFMSFCRWDQIDLTERSRHTMGRLGAAMASTKHHRKQDGLHEQQRALPASVEQSDVLTTVNKKVDFSSSCDVTIEGVELRHNGTVYTYPKCIEGVPLEKITPHHSYWDSGWPNLRDLIEPTLRSWEKKYQEVDEAVRRGEQEADEAVRRGEQKADESVKKGERAESVRKYFCGRQVNRGNTILEFLEHGEISPYQLLSKQFMNLGKVGKGTITSYNTLYRLCETLEALARYGMDVKPVDWLRKRLHEFSSEQGAGFNLSKTISEFYQDTKLAELRRNAGFKSIGRPRRS